MAVPGWMLYNNKTEESLEGLTEATALARLKLCAFEDLQYWYLWFEGMSGWEQVLTRPEFVSLKSQAKSEAPVIEFAKPQSPPQAPTSPLPTVDLSEDPGLQIFWMAEGEAAKLEPAFTGDGRERRKHERFDLRFRVMVRNENLTFKAFSKNISLGGVALEMAVPSVFIGTDCQIFIGRPGAAEYIRFAGKLVPNRSSNQVFYFFQASSENTSKMQKWIESQIARKKKSA